MRIRQIGLLVALLMVVPVAGNAEGSTNKTSDGEFHPVLGGGLFADDSDFNSELQDTFAGSGLDFQDVDNGVGTSLYLGLEAGDYVGLRLGKRRLGDQRSDIYGGSFNQKVGEAEMETEGNFVALDLMYPLNPSVFLGVTLGQYNWDTSITFEGSGGSSTGKDDGRDSFMGLRGQAMLGDGSWVATFAVESYEIEPDDSPTFEYTGVGFGLEHRF